MSCFIRFNAQNLYQVIIQGFQQHTRKPGFEFMEPLVQAMVQNDPAKRPTIDQCLIQLQEIIQSQSSWTLRSQVWHTSDNPFGFIYRFLPHWARRLVYIITQTPAIPSASTPPSIYLAMYAHVILILWALISVAIWWS